MLDLEVCARPVQDGVRLVRLLEIARRRQAVDVRVVGLEDKVGNVPLPSEARKSSTSSPEQHRTR